MKNAHCRFGHLVYTKAFKKTTTHFKLPLDRFIGESEQGSEMKAHFISVIGGDTQVAAIAAAVANRDRFTVEAPDQTTFHICLGGKAECYRGSLQPPGQRRPLRHLVAVSEELAQSANGKSTERALIFHDSAEFIWATLAYVHGLPGTEEWADWIVDELKRLKLVQPLIGIGCDPVLVRAGKGLLMNCLSRGLRERKLCLPDKNGPVHWSHTSLSHLLLPELPCS